MQKLRPLHSALYTDRGQSSFRVLRALLHRLSKTIADGKICDHFTPGDPDHERFVTKEYLTKVLLHHILDMELLPNIEEP